jgi:arylsulfatase A-like enzyme
VFVLTDDLATNLLRFMPHVQAMERQGARFENYFVADSLCCPSRASILTGKLPHNTKVMTNSGAFGGFSSFYKRGLERHTFASALKRAGYLTAMMGKYLNGYLPGADQRADGSPAPTPAGYVPPGWTQWDVAGWGYNEFNYQLNESGVLRWFGHSPRDYLTDVLARKGVRFIDRAAHRRRPFLLELSTFAPHSPYTPAPRDARDFPYLQAPRSASFNHLPSHPVSWLPRHGPLSRLQIKEINRAFRERARSVQAVDHMIGAVEQALRANGISGNTYLVFSSDNGLHMGEHQLMPGKRTAFDTDIHVPLLVTGPGIRGGTVLPGLAENIDLAETFAAIAGTRLRGDGRSLLPLLHGTPPRGWRNAVLIEHHPSVSSPNIDPDFQLPASGSPGAYHAIRTSGFLYVEYAGGEREFYDLRRDPFELHNIAGRLSRRQLLQLHHELHRLKGCGGADGCWNAMHISSLPGRW